MGHLTTSTADKDYQETLPLQFNFVAGLGEATIVTQAITVDVVVGEDETPDTILLDEPTEADGIVTQWLQDGVVGVTYHIRCLITTSDSRELVGAKNIQVIER